MNKKLVGLLCGLGAASIWGGMYVVSKVVLDIIPPFTLVSIRLLLGALTLVIGLMIRGFPEISRKQFIDVLGVGFVGYGVSLSLQFLVTKLSTAANGSLVTSATARTGWPNGRAASTSGSKPCPATGRAVRRA